jgi:hypothetical protein
MKNLADIGRRHGTDKVDQAHSFDGFTYLDVYSQYFSAIRALVTDILEIGVHEGRSMRTWQEYFPFARIHGLDIEPGLRGLNGRCLIWEGDQSDPSALRHVGTGCPLDIVIDDGSHVLDHVMASFLHLWPRIKRGGYYVIEDMQASRVDIGLWRDEWPGQRFNRPGTNYRNERTKFVELIEHRLEKMDNGEGDVMFIHFWPKLTILRKAIGS